MKISFTHKSIQMQIKTHFHMKGFALELVLKQKQKAIRKWPIISVSLLFLCNVCSPRDGNLVFCFPVIHLMLPVLFIVISIVLPLLARPPPPCCCLSLFFCLPQGLYRVFPFTYSRIALTFLGCTLCIYFSLFCFHSISP